MLTGILYALLLIMGFILIFAFLDKKDILEKYSLELSGPLLMWKTERGKKLIDRIAKKKRFWEIYGNLGIVIIVICMISMLGLVVWSAYLASQIPAEQAPSPRLIIGIPGVNPLIPVWYGILGLAAAIVVHEFSHGILARVGDIKVKTLGLIFLVVPLGAFVEPDEEEMEKMPRLKRDRIYSVGPTTNMILALVCFLLFTSVFMGAVTSREDGVIVSGIAADSPAHTAGLSWGEQITMIEGHRIESIDNFMSIDLEPGRYVNVTTVKERDEETYLVYSGVVVTTTLSDYPAHEAGLEAGDVLISLNGREIRNMDNFQEIMDNTEAYQEVTIVYHRINGEDYQEFTVENVTLADKYEGYADHYPNQKRDEYKGEGYLGVGTSYMGVGVWDSEMIPNIMSAPFEGSRSAGNFINSGLFFISYPFQGLSPMPSELTVLYEVSGPISALPTSVFWILTNSLYWIFWLNLMVGLFNALPMVPLDGGFVFRDGLGGLFEKMGYRTKKSKKIVDQLVYVLALTIFALIVWQLVGPYF
ncbi:MAG: site-2 protease family protein [Thermoplasmata archaeon]